MSTKRKKRKEKGQPCINHPNNYDTEECDRCQQFFCSECYVEDWQENFLQQFIGQKRNFQKKFYCYSCQRRVNRVHMIAYLGLLALFVTPILIWLILSFFP